MHVRRFDLLSSQFASRVFRWNVACSTAPRSSSKSKDSLYSNVHVEYGDDHTMQQQQQQQQQQQSLSTTAPSSSSSLPPPKHNLTLYDFEGSPWCRLVREYATILDLTLHIRPCPRQTLFYGEGSFTLESKFRPEAMQLYKQMKRKEHKQNIAVDGGDDGDGDGDDRNENEEVDFCMTFPLLVDRTQQLGDDDDDDEDVIVLTESYEILNHLWERYGDTVIPTTISGNNTINNNDRRRSDQIFNSNSIPFILRFLSLSGPSYVRPWPRCGIMRFPGTTTTNNNNPSSNINNNNNNKSKNTTTTNDTKITLYQSEGCSESRLVREVLCSLEIPYRSVPVADGSSNILPISCMIRTTATTTTIRIPVLEVIAHDDGNDDEHDDHIVYRVGATECVDYLREKYYDAYHRGSSNDPDDPTWFDVLPNNSNNNEDNNNIGRIGGSISIGAYTAFLKGSRSFVPERVFE